MKIKWYAHACLRIEGDGVSIITDPYTPHKSGFAAVTETADIIVRSSDDDSAHANAEMIPGDPEVVTATHILTFEGADGKASLAEPDVGRSGSTFLTKAGVRFKAIPAMESMRVKLQPRDNAMYCFVVEGIRVVHFGDVGNRLEAWQLDRIGDIDLAIVPTGGPPTIELADLHDALEILRPAVTIPMHHELPGCKFPTMADVREFTQRYPQSSVRWADTPRVELTKAALPREPQVWVLQATTAG
ncbi:MAG: MBL fold metallo-hydrolase [Caldilineaceae bacterium]|nr:MBL fold metallo-hydrolase [Caldilineaceae bacterium]